MHSRILCDLCSTSGRKTSTIPIRAVPEDVANLNTIFREKGRSSFLLGLQMLWMRRPSVQPKVKALAQLVQEQNQRWESSRRRV